MKISMLKISALVVAGMFLAGCSQTAETMIEAGTGADVEVSNGEITVTGEDGSSVTVDQEDGSVVYTDDEGTTSVQTGGDVQVPDGVPGNLPLPTGAVLTSAGENDGFYLLVWSWEGLDKKTFDSYIESVQSAGYSNKVDVMDLDLGGGAFNTGYLLSDGTTDVTIAAIADSSGPGLINMTIGPANK
jgi:predicted small secreted protein